MFRNKNKTLDIEHMLVRHGNLRTLLWQIFFFQREEVEGHDDLICELQGS